MARGFFRIRRTVAFICALGLAVSLGGTRASAADQAPLPFETAIRSIFNKLVDDVRKDLGNTSGLKRW